MGGGEEEKEETRGQDADEEKMEKDVERGGEKREGGAPQGARVTNDQKRRAMRELSVFNFFFLIWECLLIVNLSKRFIQHPQHTYIHRHTHTHTHIQVTCEIHAHAHTAIVYYDFLQLTNSMHIAKDKGHRAHGQNEILHAYGRESTPIAQGLVEDINATHAHGRSSAPIAQGLVYDINASHAFGLRESKRTYGSVSTPIP